MTTSRIRFADGLKATQATQETPPELAESMLTPKIVINEKPGSTPLTKKLDIGLAPHGSGGYRNEEMEMIL